MSEKKNGGRGRGGDDEPPVDAEITGGETEVVETSALTAITRAEIDVQISTAKAYPRSIDQFRKDAFQMATVDEKTADEMFFALERWDAQANRNKHIFGPSIRLAEVCLSAWRNTHVASRPVAVEDRWVRAQGVAWDLERNVRQSVEVTRRIVGKTGKRYGDDMIGTTMQAASAIARRNAIFGVVPRVYIDALVEECKAVVAGQKQTMTQRWAKILEQFGVLGAVEKQVLLLVHRKGAADVSIEDILFLKGLRTAIEEGQQSLADALEAAEPQDQPATIRPSTLTADKIAKPASVSGKDDAKRTPAPPAEDAATAAARASATAMLNNANLSPAARAAAQSILDALGPASGVAIGGTVQGTDGEAIARELRDKERLAASRSAAPAKERNMFDEPDDPAVSAAAEPEPGSEEELDRFARIFDEP